MEQSLQGLELGSYHLKERIGSGGMGQIYRATDNHMSIGRDVAVKVMVLDASTTPSVLSFRVAIELYVPPWITVLGDRVNVRLVECFVVLYVLIEESFA